MTERQIERQNIENRKLDIEQRRYYIEDFLRENVLPSENFLINGSGTNRKTALFERILQLYLDEDVLDRPLIVISSDGALLKGIINELKNQGDWTVRESHLIDKKNRLYKPFDGMVGMEIDDAIKMLASQRSMPDLDRWNSDVFTDTCEILDSYGYEVSIENLCKVFQQKKESIITMLRSEKGEASSETAINNSYSAIRDIIRKLANNFSSIADYGNGISVLGKVLEKKIGRKNMPCFFFQLPDDLRVSFLDYLASELMVVGKYRDPIIVVDSVPLSVGNKEGVSQFFSYLEKSLDIALNLSSEACDSLVPNERLESFIKLKGFRMLFTKGGASGERLTRIEFGTYDHCVIERTQTIVRAIFHIIAHDKNTGVGTKTENRARVRSEDLEELGNNEAFLLYRETGIWYKNLLFD